MAMTHTAEIDINNASEWIKSAGKEENGRSFSLNALFDVVVVSNNNMTATSLSTIIIETACASAFFVDQGALRVCVIAIYFKVGFTSHSYRMLENIW